MSRTLEIHMIQNFAPSNLNRDDTGSPKDAFFGGSRRARISSQCLKRSIRTRFASDPADRIPDEHLAVRTQRVTERLSELLEERGRSTDDTDAIIEVALGGLSLTLKDGMSQYLLFLGNQELDRVAELIDEHWDALSGAVPSDGKKSGKPKLPKELTAGLDDALDGGKAIDVALFGRMLANLPHRNQDAAAQVAHAISTHKVEREFDFYTAVDDLNTAADTGAGMLGTIEFNSACFYRYAALDLDLLAANLLGDDELAIRGVGAFLRASIVAIPTGKQSSFAAHNPPSFVGVSVRSDAVPRNLVNAFEKPVPNSDEGLTDRSVALLIEEWMKLDAAYGVGDNPSSAYMNLTDADSGDLNNADAKQVTSVEELVASVVSAVRATVGG
jgi:CRISPR system Cascade subunit CasC